LISEVTQLHNSKIVNLAKPRLNDTVGQGFYEHLLKTINKVGKTILTIFTLLIFFCHISFAQLINQAVQKKDSTVHTGKTVSTISKYSTDKNVVVTDSSYIEKKKMTTNGEKIVQYSNLRYPKANFLIL